MERWYLPIRCHPRGRGDKHADRLIEEISNYIRRHQLYNLVPVIHVEKKPKGEFYFFLGIDSEQRSNVPAELGALVKMIGHSRGESVEYDEIERMVSGPMIPRDYARRITYREQQEPVQDDPFDLFETISVQQEIAPDELAIRSGNYNKLLSWLSGVGSGTWQAFKNICRILDLDSSGMESRRILRILRLLGHLEVSHDGSRWTTCPPCLVAVESTPMREYILAGQRCEQLLEDMRVSGYTVLNPVEQPDGRAPVAVHVQLASENSLGPLMEGVGSHYSLIHAEYAAHTLAEILPDLDGWRDHLTPVGGFLLPFFEVEQFVNGTFIRCDFQGESGMYRLRHRDSNDQVSQTLFYDQSSERWLQGDWYGLRFLALQQTRVECRALYHLSSRRLALSASQRWPELYERSLVLCSGQLSEQRSEWLFFNNIPRELAQKLAAKLTVTYEEIQ